MEPDKHPDKIVALLDTEERLLADTDGTYRKELAAKLAQLDGEVQTRLRAMNAPDEYARLRNLALGIEAATRVLSSCCQPQ
ncbi:MAG: hypothetical protein NTZ09_19400 [Candidatus Hydrogenedentes bacterium]|nr:hypothetical protein [Candidatus Hydrogenedentota bacterium]